MVSQERDHKVNNMKKRSLILILGFLLLSGCNKSEITVITSEDAIRVETLDESIYMGIHRSIKIASENSND